MLSTINLNQITQITEDIAKANGFLLVDVRMSQQGSHRTLEVTIHAPDGSVSISDCEKISRSLEEAFENQAVPLIDGAFVLEVQSPGIDRQLRTTREFAIFTGHNVEVKTKQEQPGLGNNFRGTLTGSVDGAMKLTNLQTIIVASKKQQKSSPVSPVPTELTLGLDKVISVKLHPEDSLQGRRNVHYEPVLEN